MSLSTIKDDFLFSLRHPQLRLSIAGFMISLFIALFVGIVFWWPITHNVNKLRDEITSRQREIANSEYKAKLANVSVVADQQMALVDKKLNASISQAVLVQNIAVLARKHNVKIVSVAYEDGKATSGYLPLVHVLTVQAGYAQLRSFIAGLDQLPTFTIVQEAILNRAANSIIIKAQLNVTTYRRDMGPKI